MGFGRKKRLILISALVLAAVLLLITGIWLLAKASGRVYEEGYPMGYEKLVLAACEEQGLSPALVFSVIRTESGFRPEVESSVGARGLMQITEETFDWIRWKMDDQSGKSYDDLFQPELNIQYGTFLLSVLIEEFGSESNALCAYHAGWGNAKKWLEDPQISPDGKNIEAIPFGDTKQYVQKVLDTKQVYESLYDLS